MNSKLNLIFLQDISSLSMAERFMSYLIYVSIPALFSIWTYLTYNNVGYLYLLFSFLFFYACLFVPCFRYESWIRKYGEFSSIKFRSTYQYSSRFLPLLGIGFSAIVLAVSNLLNQLNVGISIFLSFIIPSVCLFFKTDVFNESSCYLDDETVFGYPPNYYGLISLIIGVCEAYTIQNLINTDLNLAVLSLIVTAVFQFIAVSPDLFNKILPFEIRKTEGFILFIILTIALYLIILNFMGISISNMNITLNAQNIMTWIAGIIIAILIIRQGRSMNKKKK